MQPSVKLDMNDFLAYPEIAAIFTGYFLENLEFVSSQVLVNAISILTLLIIHLAVVLIHAYYTVPSFRHVCVWDKLLHTLANTWLVLPFRELSGADRGQEVP
jgi:hypothetical protein